MKTKKPLRIEYPYDCKECKLINGKVKLCPTAKELFKKYGTTKEYQKHFKLKSNNYQV